MIGPIRGPRHDATDRVISTTAPPQASVRREHLAALLEGCAQGREAALAELYGLTSAQLYAVVLRILKIEAIAEEALQEAYVKIWDNAGGYTPELGAPMTWMGSIARNQALDILRRRGRHERHESTVQVSLIDAMPDLAKSPQEMSADAEPLLRCLDRLPEATRECIVKAYCEGYSHDELSDALETPLGTVKSWIRRGLVALRKCLDELA